MYTVQGVYSECTAVCGFRPLLVDETVLFLRKGRVSRAAKRFSKIVRFLRIIFSVTLLFSEHRGSNILYSTYALSWTMAVQHRRRIELEDKAKVVASDWGTESLPG